MNSSVTYANQFGEMIGPLLWLMRSTGFFEAYVFMPLMTLIAIVLLLRVRNVTDENGTFDSPMRAKLRKLWLFAYGSLCFVVTNSTAVAFKTLIIEETDYVEIPDFIAWVSPLHFYITSVGLVHLWLVLRRHTRVVALSLASLYVQIGLIGGYGVAIHRMMNEPFELFDVTTGVSGIFFTLWFGLLNWDLLARLRPFFVARENSSKMTV